MRRVRGINLKFTIEVELPARFCLAHSQGERAELSEIQFIGHVAASKFAILGLQPIT